ncbi:hypothetical protein ABIB34_004248, partial [Rhodococcus sp. UYP5]
SFRHPGLQLDEAHLAHSSPAHGHRLGWFRETSIRSENTVLIIACAR